MLKNKDKKRSGHKHGSLRETIRDFVAAESLTKREY